jgi:hypothetical protein
MHIHKHTNISLSLLSRFSFPPICRYVGHHTMAGLEDAHHIYICLFTPILEISMYVQVIKRGFLASFSFLLNCFNNISIYGFLCFL